MSRCVMILVLAAAMSAPMHAEPATELPAGPRPVQPLLIGSQAPGGVWKDATGADFDLQAALDARPTILVFYRAHWRGHCRRQLVQLQEDADALNDLGFQIIAACIDPPEKLSDSAGNWGVKFPLLSDPQLQLAHAHGVAYRPAGKRGLPVPAVFLIDADGVIQSQHVNPKYQVRLARGVSLAAARAMASTTE